MNKTMAALSLFLALNPVLAFAGGWVGSGGDIVGNESNPWFLGNVKSVRYCVFINETDVSLDSDKVRSRIADALHYWKEEFKAAFYPGLITGLPSLEPATGIGTQTFVEENCPNSIDVALRDFDVVFQVGILTKQQNDFITDPTRHVALTIRTQYDEQDLRGKGFIYIAPDRGALRPASSDFREDAWLYNDGALLAQVAAHELGHLFGLRHLGPQFLLMSADYPAFITTKMGSSLSKKIPNFYRPESEYSDLMPCRILPRQYEFALSYFGAPSDHVCIKLTVIGSKLQVATSRAANETFTVIGEALLDTGWQNMAEGEIRIGFNASQRVFSYLSSLFTSLGMVPSAQPMTRTYKTMFVPKNGGVIRPITFIHGPNKFQVMATRTSGEIVDNVMIGR